MTPDKADLLPATLDLDRLPPLATAGEFVSRAANAAVMALGELSSAHSKRAYGSRLTHVAHLLGYADYLEVPWEKLRYPHVVAIKAYLADTDPATGQPRLGYASINVTLAAIKAACRAALKLGRIRREDLHAIEDVRTLKGERGLAGREIKSGELQALMQVCMDDDTAAGPRDATIFGLLFVAGLRRAEVASLNVEHYDAEAQSFTVIGKGNKARTVFIIATVADALADWLLVRSSLDGSLFFALRRGGHLSFNSNGRLSDQAIYNIVKKRVKQAGITSCSPHDFRRTFATELLRQGTDLATVQRLMGHHDPKTTSRYDRRHDSEASVAVNQLHLPYVRRSDRQR